ncbi:MAG: ABC transporter ATP-binding protein, partial [Pseudomonadota bacterium]
VTCLLGPSGCGKTTLMRMIAGLERPTEGRILIDGADVTDLPPRRRDIAMVFQYPVMYPTLSVRENIEEPLRHARLSAAERARRVDEMLDVLDMRDVGGAFIGDLGAGQRQRVAVGRATARQASVMLFDEPTTNVEVHTKLALIRAFKLVTARLEQTILYVTHDQTEAMTLADRIALMRDGRIVQHDTPRALYAAPRDRFAGWFIGNPGMNYVPAQPGSDGLHSPVLAHPLPRAAQGEDIALGIRPEAVAVGPANGPGVPATVEDRSIGIGGRRHARLRLGDGTIVNAKVPPGTDLPLGGEVRLRVDHSDIATFANGQRIDPSPADTD